MPKAPNGTPHLYLIDGSGYIFRAYHAMAHSRKPLSRSDGTPMGAVFGFSNMLMKLLRDLDDDEKPTHLAIIFDAKGKTFRNNIYADYKANRPPAPEDLVPQFPIIRDAVRAFGLPSIEMDGFEADDLIATYTRQAREEGWHVTIVSSDKDLMQMVDDKTDMFDTMKNVRTDPEGVVAKFGVEPGKVIEVQALAGDSADNVPGVPGIGIKTAAELINHYGDLESLLANAEEIKQPKRREKLIENADLARVSRELVTLDQHVAVEHAIDGFQLTPPDAEPLIAFFEAQEFRSLKVKAAHAWGKDLPPDPVSDAVELVEKDYVCVTDKPTLDAWIKLSYEAGIIAVDTETTGLDATAADLVGISIATAPGKACYIPVGHGGAGGDLLSEKPDQLGKALVLDALKPLFEDPTILKVGQNLKYDLSILARQGLDVTPFDDTMLMSYALEAGMHNHGMDELSGIHLDITPIPFKEIAGTGKNQITFDQVPLDKATDYAAEDADITLRLHMLLKPRLAA